MDKQEILQKAQQENKDERILQIRDRSLTWTYITMVIVAAIFAEIRAAAGEPFMDLCATICASVCVGQAYRFIKTKDTHYLILALITLAVGVFALVRFCMGH